METVLPRRRKSQGSIRSPLIKRDNQSQVVIEGWLHKLEGGALKQWKHRWCVLADFCLFSYKGPGEEKVSSSVLLPSYKIGPCTNQDKISRKFAFKAEHQNMKTYYFAAENKEYMKRWMNAMSLASIMQKFSRCEIPEVGPLSSTSNDDEDSGFTSFRSRRYGSHDPNSTLDGSYNSEPLHQRSSSYGDRVGEMYLSSDDKYPNAYKNHRPHPYKALSVEQSSPAKQPLYANAPPKPRRLTQSDPFAISPSEQYDNIGHDNLTPNYSQRHYQESDELSGDNYPRTRRISTKVFQEKTSPIHDDDFHQSSDNGNMQYKSDVTSEHKGFEQPPRPHSADFLERDDEFRPATRKKTTERSQPQRPKSSLECYDRYWEADECGFYDYREAVRTQADHFYTNKSFRHNQVPYNKRERDVHSSSDLRPSSQSTVEKSLISSTRKTDNRSELFDNDDYSYGTNYHDPTSASAKHHSHSSGETIPRIVHSSKKKTHEESMRRLIEWKQRMLQSPLTKRSARHSPPPDTNSSQRAPVRPPLPNEYRLQVLQELENHEARLRIHHLSNDRNILGQDVNDHSSHADFFCELNSQSLTSNSMHNDTGKYEANICSPETFSGQNSHFINDKKEHEHCLEGKKFNGCDLSGEENKKVMYCVDAENNEILISYEAGDVPVETMHTPDSGFYICKEQQVESVAATSNKNQTVGSYNEQEKTSDQIGTIKDVRKTCNQKTVPPRLQRNNLSSRGSSRGFSKSVCYSSDDEDKNQMECRHTRRSAKTNRKSTSGEAIVQISKEEPDVMSTPDYVNIKMVMQTQSKLAPVKPLLVEEDFKCIGNGHNANFNEINFAENHGLFLNSKVSACSLDKNHCIEIPDKTTILTKDSFSCYSGDGGDKELDMKREDYYRASQLFYPLPQIKKDSPLTSGKICVQHAAYIHSSVVDEHFDNQTKQSIKAGNWNLDKDIGIPPPSFNFKVREYNGDSSFQHLEFSELSMEANSVVSEKSVNVPYLSELGKTENVDISISPHDVDFLIEHSDYTESCLIQKNAVPNPEKEKWNNPAAFANLSLVKKNASFEEMRLLLQQQREAPPPNIVQERIKRFELAKNVSLDKEHGKNVMKQDILPKSKSVENFARESQMKYAIKGKKAKRRFSDYGDLPKRYLHSDSETACVHDSDDILSDSSFTMKSDPILLSPLSSVLADLRKTADIGDKKIKQSVEYSDSVKSLDPTEKKPNIIMRNAAMTESRLLSNSDKQLLPSSSFNMKSSEVVPNNLKKVVDVEEEAYLPMSIIKSFEEPEYVAMDDSKLGSSVLYYEIPSKETVIEDEPLYNEPFLPPPSFLHDVYEKQKTKHIPFDDSSSSSDDMSENIYEKPKTWLPVLECQKNSPKKKDTECSNSPNALSNKMTGYISKNKDANTEHTSTNVAMFSPFYKQADLPCNENYSSIPQSSVPDLLQLQEIKHSDASDADDEASRDFDTNINLYIPSYQSAILDQCQNVEEQNIVYKYDGHSSFDSEIISFCNKEVLDASKNRLETDCQLSSTQDLFSDTSEYKELNRTFSSLPIVSICGSNSCVHEEAKQDSTGEKQIHFRKLRVYTKGKKPEGPKIYPVPLNIDERDVYCITEFKNEHDLHGIFYEKPIGVDLKEMHNISISTDETKNMSLSKEGNYLQLGDGSIPCKPISLKLPNSSPVPDVIPSDLVEDKLSWQKLSSSACRSANSAPYYYSDLLPENSFSSNHLGMSNFNMDVLPSPRSTRPMLNNVRNKSPGFCDKGEIGRKVNNIQKEKKLTIDDDTLSNTSSLNYSLKSFKEVSVDRKSELKFSLDQFQRSESKFLDAERNKYEAGHTLEKTKRSSSTLSYFKHRSSTPDLKLTYNSSEPVYENLIFEPNQSIHQRSCSLEGLCKVPEFVSDSLRNNDKSSYGSTTDCHIDGGTSPIYENIEFVFHSVENDGSNRLCNSTSIGSGYSKEINGNYTSPIEASLSVPIISTLSTTKKQIENNNTSCSYELSHPSRPCNSKLSSGKPSFCDDDDSFLDQHELRRVSEQHFFGKHTVDKLSSKKLHSSGHLERVPAAIPLLMSEKMHNPKKFVSSETPETEAEVLHATSLINVEQDFSIANFSSICLQRDSEIDSSSLSSSSSVDEASNDSEYRNKCTISRNKSPLFRSENNVSDSEIQVKGSSHLKKLVKQSECLTSKGKRLSISAGDLLGKTHEELVLLLIQLRRNQSRISRAKEKCQEQLENEEKLFKVGKNGQQGYSQNVTELARQILQLEKQYEVTQPIVNLVDNMVKLGSLYGSSDKRSTSFLHLDNTCISLTSANEKALPTNTVDESPIWSTLLKEEKDLQGHLNEIYHLDRGLRQETHSFSSLQQDKEMLEHTLLGMKNKILDHQDKPIELQRLRKQQKMIEKELSRVKRLLSHSAKKIEEATAKNDQLEQEILQLRQKIQQALKSGACEMETCLQSRADLEAELTRVQNVLEELANHRQEISNTVEKLRNEARSKISSFSPEVRASPTGVAGSAPLPLRKKQQSAYLETDLDTMETRNLALSGVCRDLDDIPVYVNAEEINSANQEKSPDDQDHSVILPQCGDSTQYLLQDISDADDRMKRFYGILPREKTSEIKTVRIVKRQSERRSRERDKKRVTYDDQSLVWVMEEPDVSMSSDEHLEIEEDDLNRTKSLSSSNHRPTSIPLPYENSFKIAGSQSAHERLFGRGRIREEENVLFKRSSEHSPEKRWKRRHYTVSGYQCMLDPQLSQFSQDKPRSRDDVDMERCLRTANTPDIVRSTIKKKEVFDERIIERELGLPQKIVIPERYIEDEPEHLSAREKLKRSLKAENIRKMLSETTTFDDLSEEKRGPPGALRKKLSEEKRKRAHLLALNHTIAQEVMERSKVVAANVYCTETQASP